MLPPIMGSIHPTKKWNKPQIQDFPKTNMEQKHMQKKGFTIINFSISTKVT